MATTTTTNKQFLVRTGVNLPAGTALQAPLSFQAGPVLTTLTSGSMEWDGYNLFATEASADNTSPANLSATVRRTLAYTDSVMQPTMSNVTATGNNQTGSTQINTALAYVTGGTGDNTLPITGIVANGTTWVVTYTPDTYNPSGSYTSGSITISGVIPTLFNGTYTIASGTGSTFTITNTTPGTYSSGGTIPVKFNSFNGVALPPAISGRTVHVINKSLSPVYVYPGKAASAAAGSSVSGSTTITVTSTSTLLPGMVVSVSGGTGAFTAGTKIVSILTATTFVVNIAPTTALIGATISINAGNSSSINGLSAGSGYLVLDGTSITLMATSNTEWFTSSAASMGANNGVAGIYQANDIIYAIDSTNLGGINAAASGNVLLSNGTTAAPSYGKVNLATMVSGQLPIANGGTGSAGTSLTGSATYSLLNTGTTSISFGGAATSISIGTVGGMTTVASDFTVAGNLIVTGSQIIANTTDTSIQDSVIQMHEPVTGFLFTNDGKDIGLRYHYHKPIAEVNSIVVTGGSATLAACNITISSSIQYAIGAVITVANVVPAAYNGTYTVTGSTSTTVSYTAATSPGAAVTTTSGTVLGTVKQLTQFTGATGVSSSTTATITYTGPKLLSALLTITNYSSASTTVSVVSTAGLSRGMYLTNGTPSASFSPNTFITNVVNSTSFTINQLPTNVTAITTGTLLAGSLVTISGMTPGTYDGTYVIANANVNTFNITTTGSNLGNGTGATITFADRSSFSGWANDSQSFEFYKEGVENVASGTVANVFTGIYGNVKAGSFQAITAASYTAAEITAGVAIKIPAGSVYNYDSTTGATVAQGSVVSIGKATFNTAATGVIHTNLASLYIEDAPAVGNIVTSGNKYAIQVVAGDTLLGGDLAVNGGDITSSTSTFNLLNTTVTTANAFGAANTIAMGAAGSTLTLGKTATNNNTAVLEFAGGNGSAAKIQAGSGVSSAELFVTNITAATLFSVAGTIDLAKTYSSATAFNFNIAAGNTTSGATSTLTLGGGVTGNAIYIKSATNGTISLKTDVTTGTAEIFTTVTGNVKIGNGAAKVYIGSAGDAQLIIAGGTTSGTSTLATDNVAVNANVFNDNSVITGKIFNGTAAKTIEIANSYNTAGAATVSILGTSASASNTLTFGGAIGSGSTNAIKIGGTTNGVVSFDAVNAVAFAKVFPTTTANLSIGAATTDLVMQNTTTSASTLNIAALTAANANTMTYGGLTTGTSLTAGNRILINSAATSSPFVSFDSAQTNAVGNIFSTPTGTVNVAANATIVNIANATAAASAIKLNTGNTSTTGTTLTIGGAVTGTGFNTLEIAGNTAAANKVAITTTATGTAEIFTNITGTITIGSATALVSPATGVVKLGVSPSQTATGTEVVTAAWILARTTAVDGIQTEFSTTTAGQILDAGFDWGVYRAAKYTLQITQIGSLATRTQSSEILINTDAPVYTSTAGATNSSTTITVASTVGLYVGMTVSVSSGTGTFAVGGTTVLAITAITFTVSLAPSTALSASAIVKGVMAGRYTSANTASASLGSATVTVGNTAGLYPGMAIEVTGGAGAFPVGTYVTSITNATTFVASANTITSAISGGVITGTPNIYITEYAVLETNGTAAIISSKIDDATTATLIPLTISPQLGGLISAGGTATKMNIGTISKTIVKAERQMIELT